VGHPFRAAVEAGDIDAGIATLHPEVVFNSPAVFRPYLGRDTVAGVLRAAFDTFEDFEYTDELEGAGVHALIFRARVGDKQLQGIDLLRTDDEGLITDFTVMVRPASGLMALGEAMGPKVAHLTPA
jgi:hypothetical protein